MRCGGFLDRCGLEFPGSVGFSWLQLMPGGVQGCSSPREYGTSGMRKYKKFRCLPLDGGRIGVHCRLEGRHQKPYRYTGRASHAHSLDGLRPRVDADDVQHHLRQR